MRPVGQYNISWSYSPLWGAVLIICYLVSIAALPVTVFLSADDGDSSLLMLLGNMAGLLGFSILVMQFVMTARIKILERPFGMDLLMRFHRRMGMLALFLVVAHPVLFAVDGWGWSIFGLDTSWQVNLGKGAFLILVLSIILALFYKKFHIDYNLCRWFHKLSVLVVVLGFWHGLALGEDLQEGPVRIVWILFFAVAMAVFLYRNLYVPLLGRRKFRVESVEMVGNGIWTLTVSPVSPSDAIDFLPGQFCFLKLKRPGRGSEEHPFSISSAPADDGVLQFTVKESGNFTRTIGKTVAGDLAYIEGGYGRFSYRLLCSGDEDKPLLFIAGGVGITPVMSMLRAIHNAGDHRRVELIYAARCDEEIIFQNELATMSVRVVKVLSRPEGVCDCETGHLCTDIIMRNAGDIITSAHVFLCGPPPMMKSVLGILRELNIDRTRIHFEAFSF